jgi:glutathione S-transferase
VSGNAYKVRLALAQLGLAYRCVPIDILGGEARAEEFRRLNPFGRVPFLVHGDVALGESNAILVHLTHGTALWPAEHADQMRALQWMFFEQMRRRAGHARTPPRAERQPGFVSMEA